MDRNLRLESRLASLVALILVGYGLCVASLAAAHGQLPLLATWRFSSTVTSIWIISFAFVFIGYAIDLMARRRPARLIETIVADARRHVLRRDLLLARATIVVGFIGMMTLFGPVKIMLGHVQGFPYDRLFMELDRALFLGTDPWRVTHALFGPLGTYALHIAYNTWFVMMWVGMIYFLFRPERVRERAHYLVAFLLTWILVGSLAAWLLASAGPCFYERAFGDPHYAPLMDRLAVARNQLAATGLKMWGLELQDMLWNAYADEKTLFGGGISAMPSVHVAVSTLMACAAYAHHRRVGHLLAGFAVAIWIGSIHLGWHYALDGVVAAPMTLAIWKLSGWLVDRFVFAETPAASLRPALAE